MIKNKKIKRNSIQREIACEQQFGNINEICLGKSKFLSINNVKGIPDNYNDMIVYTIGNNGNNVNKIYMISNGEEGFLNDEKIGFLVGIIDRTIQYIDTMFKVKNNNNFNLILLGSSSKKYFPEKGQELTEDNVNSADSTFYGTGDITLRIQRKEELIKVLIHEVIHYTGIENGIIGIGLDNIFNVDSPNNKILLNEAVVETLATYINCMIYSEIYKKDLGGLINMEINFGMLQTAKILDHFGFVSVHDFLNNKNKKIKQKTSAFEYHILKTILLMNYEEFVEFVKNSTLLEDMIMNEFKNKKYQEKINKYIGEIELLPENIKKTFRMTMIEIK
ncbi:MAG: hypothetical protein MUO21_02750 [Nitrososphaeraceae archaeon]|nr:hypothetical protein [Nitrososphaeraceae archaeon]